MATCGRGWSRITARAALLAATACLLDGSGKAFATSSSSASLSANPDGCVTDYDATAGVDYFPEKAELRYAQAFSVEYFSTYKVLNITGSSLVYVLYQCGTPEPDVEDADVFISVPVTSVAVGTPAHIPRIELLGHRDSIVAYTGDVTTIGSPCVDALVADGTVVEATFSDDTCGTTANNTMLQQLDVNASFGDSVYTNYCNVEERYKAVAVETYLESGEEAGLGHGEAIKLFGLFYNEEAKAAELFDEIESLWFCTKNNAQGCSIQLDSVPTVAWFSYVALDGSGWNAPAEDTYYAYAVNNTGGELVTCDNFSPSSSFELMDNATMLACFQEADVCVFGADHSEVQAAYGDEVLGSLACVQNERVYDITLSGVNTWFEALYAEPHVLMEDMVVALHGEDYDYGIGSYERLLLRHVFSEESNSGTYYPDIGECDNPDAASEIQGECDIIIDFATCTSAASTVRLLPGAAAFMVTAGMLLSRALATTY